MINKNYYSLLVFLSDVLGVVLAWWLAYLVRFNFVVPPEFMPAAMVGLGVAVVVQGTILRAFGLYRGVWVFASLPDLLRIARAVAVATLVTPLVVVVVVRHHPEVPRLVFLMQPLLLAVYAGGTRALYRTWKEFHLYGAIRAKIGRAHV